MHRILQVILLILAGAGSALLFCLLPVEVEKVKLWYYLETGLCALSFFFSAGLLFPAACRYPHLFKGLLLGASLALLGSAYHLSKLYDCMFPILKAHTFTNPVLLFLMAGTLLVLIVYDFVSVDAFIRARRSRKTPPLSTI